MFLDPSKVMRREARRLRSFGKPRRARACIRGTDQGTCTVACSVDETLTLAYAHHSPHELSRTSPAGHRLPSSRAVPTSIQTFCAETVPHVSGLYADVYALVLRGYEALESREKRVMRKERWATSRKSVTDRVQSEEYLVRRTCERTQPESSGYER